jgi:hypothetical protein
MTTPPRPTHKEFDVDHEYGRQARAPGGISRDAALLRAAAEIERVKPQVSDYIMQECHRLDAALHSANAEGHTDASSVAEAYASSQRLRDVAQTVGYPLLALIATNLCTIFEALEAAQVDYPAAVIECHHKALRLALSRRYRDKEPKDLPELSAGLWQIAKLAQAMRADAKTDTPADAKSEQLKAS